MALLALALFLRLLVPVGWMPDERGFGIRPCVAAAPQPMAAEHAHHAHHDEPAPQRAPEPQPTDQSCPFAALAAPLGAPPTAPEAFLQPLAPEAMPLASPHRPVALPGAAALPPPQTGPPLSA